jgi:hypothetical protein
MSWIFMKERRVGSVPDTVSSVPEESVSASQPGATEVSLALTESALQWVSVLMRLSIGTLFLSAAFLKMPGGVPGTIAYYNSLFKNSLLPQFLVSAHASVIIYCEFTIALWLLTGFRLTLAWKVAGFLLLSLAVGMVFAGKYDVASANYLYILFCALGLISSPWDRWVVGRAAARRRAPHP